MTRTHTYVVAALSLLAATVVRGADLKEFAGMWAMRLGERNLFVLTLMPQGDHVQGSFSRPAQMSVTNSLFVIRRNSVRHDSIARSQLANGALRLTFQNANDPKDQDNFTMTVTGNHAELMYADVPPESGVWPLLFERAAADSEVATDWEPNRAYVQGDSDVSNPEMKAIFDEDQRVRQTEHVDWGTVSRTDAARRERTRKLLAAGALHTGKDYEEAAFVFQHGDSSQDYLLAHTLAMVAVSKGDATAIAIASLTLDRYLQNIGQKQIFGSQFLSDPKNNWTQEPYDRTLISDALRKQLGIPSQAAQALQLKAYQTQK